MKKILLITIIAFIGNLNGYSQTSKIEYGNNPDAGHYVNVNGIKLYYEVYVEGEPLLLIHGNGGSIRGHSDKIEHFKNKYQVIAADNRAHGKTQDIGDSLTYKNMTSDFNELLEHKPKNNAIGMAAEMGIELLTEEQYRELQKLGIFDLKTSSWIVTPTDIREKGGALFCDYRFGHVFVYHNGAESYYAARGFRGSIRV